MKYRGLEQIALEADVHPDLGMSRRERLARWVELLERQPDRRLSTIEGTEFGSRRERGPVLAAPKQTSRGGSPWYGRQRARSATTCRSHGMVRPLRKALPSSIG
jgi:hypothetical protein